ncbi:Bifunctional riboflavin kinase/FMN adenylyltransferase [Baekduia alba]|uniref:bifunctional riboflavin kinase/FAD synthetase n=1 Tax=Baekduia alba TaxID=2997333 RepID=UPI0023421D27|nr:bifunctional riboflavin kinase/FAD synthetase [Baekduia alba]WCB94229.1 Bifunctional riboflavin kinase/FMN adenylyltransferase [Baekduia alba]
MKLTYLPDVEPRPRRVAIGTFDGVHLGHREVIAGAETVVTFDPHPQSVVAPGSQPKLLTTLDRKAELIASLGVAELVVIPFDGAFAARDAQDFVDHVLVERVQATHVSVGENFRFGHKAHGDAQLLSADPRFETRVVPLLEVDGEVVSSSHIRGLVSGGAVNYADALLGAPFAVDGEVQHGDKRGRTLGFPTANLVPRPGYVTPGHGVYACRAALPDGTVVAAATNVGVRPQFVTGRGELIEAFLIDWSGDLYGAKIRVEFLRRLRGERRFASVDALVAQMRSDVDEAREIVAG